MSLAPIALAALRLYESRERGCPFGPHSTTAVTPAVERHIAAGPKSRLLAPASASQVLDDHPAFRLAGAVVAEWISAR
jgi:hypothetical protein